MTQTIEERHSELMDAIETIIKLQALSAVSHLETKKERILFLSETGLTPKVTAGVVGSTAAAVSQTIYAEKKRLEKGNSK